MKKQKEIRNKKAEFDSSDFDLEEAVRLSEERAAEQKARGQHNSKFYEVDVRRTYEENMARIEKNDPDREMKIKHLQEILMHPGRYDR